jgi:hypothetical protein
MLINFLFFIFFLGVGAWCCGVGRELSNIDENLCLCLEFKSRRNMSIRLYKSISTGHI